MLSRHSVGTYQGNKLTRNSSGNARPQSSQLAKPLWNDPDLNTGISVRELISTSNKQTNKETQAWNERSDILPKSSPARKKTTTAAVVVVVVFLDGAFAVVVFLLFLLFILLLLLASILKG